MYNLNLIIVIVFNCIRAYARGYTLIRQIETQPNENLIV